MFKLVNHLRTKYFLLFLFVTMLSLNQSTNRHILANHIETILIHLKNKSNTISYYI